MHYPLNTPLGRMGVQTLEESPDRCVASISVGGLLNPLTRVPTIAPLAMLVDHIGGLINHYRRHDDEWTVSSELAVELAPNAIELVTATPEVPVLATGRPFGPKGTGSLGLCELTHGGQLVGTATVRSFHIHAPGHVVEWPTDSTEGTPPCALQDRMSIEVAETGGGAAVLRQLPDPVINNSIGIVHGGVSAAALELVGSAALGDGAGAPWRTASLRVNYLRQFRGGNESRYEARALRIGRSTGVADAQAVGDDGKVALLARLTAYR
ncbi:MULTISPECIES: PaaI family thioesterase [unclassified Mycolicibacterium]|uniref:PaaI family thioesterase n=1 Tax=unclassified Mycolicibacterium TaxID=2636767 RepID=UPI0012DF0509|nr:MULTISPECIES: PaaI family thioesterase [unclassified Mycolicibacterium]MUL83171.1 PaaI family thioesterase [Mycolicibacterium sp. CBMA 329]MUL89506.1 PaaI family thioesterase [Mycolicibacterium sp. CBMA 331]MUM02737.1 PaaI family thioesterase [Mycolicibacterium sp. CBMA 334]MUM29909.1 PaaI family thioesterase [Mycolicibacterium sp. CBMA 295]MUM39022.1 PaaI family thioesterase [Mycolicibacterium sp. CBMA 247]